MNKYTIIGLSICFLINITLNKTAETDIKPFKPDTTTIKKEVRSSLNDYSDTCVAYPGKTVPVCIKPANATAAVLKIRA